VLSDIGDLLESSHVASAALVIRFIDKARADEAECVQTTCTGRIDPEGFSGESFLVFNR
jgi:hypothetical protein